MKWKSPFGVNATAMIMQDDTMPLVLFVALLCTYSDQSIHKTEKILHSNAYFMNTASIINRNPENCSLSFFIGSAKCKSANPFSYRISISRV